MNVQETIAQVHDHIRGMWRFRWVATGLAWLLFGAGLFYVFTMPDVYQASARIFVDTNSLLRPLMQGLTAQQDPLDELGLVSVAVLSRPNLERVAHDTDLALNATSPQEMEDLVTRLQERIELRRDADNTYRINYEYFDRRKAVDVVDALLDTFIESAIGNEGEDSDQSERALASELRTHEDRLREAEAALAEFKRENVGYMPGDAGDYYQQLQNANLAVGQSEQQIRQLTERRDELERQLEGETPVFGIMSGTGLGDCSQRPRIQENEAALEQLLIEYTEEHPRYRSLRDRIDVLTEQCARELESAGGSALPPAAVGGEGLEANTVYQNLRLMLSETEVELASQRAELGARRARLDQLQRDVDKIIDVETQLTQLNREYGVIEERHQELLGRMENLQAARRLDPVTDPVQFRIIEPPFALAEPVGPNRPLMLLMVLAVALAASVAVPFVLNQIRPTFFTVQGLRKSVSLPVLGAIGLIRTEGEIAQQRVEKVAFAACYLLLLLVAVAAIAFAGPAASFLSGG